MNIEKISTLLHAWDEVNNEGSDPTQILMDLAVIFELEMQDFLKKNPDPFDDRHPSRLHPDCTFGRCLKTFFRDERIVDEMVKVYCQRDFLPLSIATCRLLLGILPGLEGIVFQEEGFVPKLLSWAENAPDPLRSYATGLLAAAMETPEIASDYKERNAYFVPLMLSRLKELSFKYLQDLEPPDSADVWREKDEFIPERPFACLGGKNDEMSNPDKEDGYKNNSRKTSRKKKDVSKTLRFSPYLSPIKSSRKPNVKISSAKTSNFDEGSNSNWTQVGQYVIGAYEVYPLNLAGMQRYILQYLTPMGEYSDLLGHVLENNALSLTLRYIDLRQNSDVRLAFEATKYLASLLCHKKIAIEFLNIGGLQQLLKVPFPSIAATGVSICLYYLAHIEEAMEKICCLPTAVIHDVVRYALSLLECSHDSSRCHATMFFGFAFPFKIVLDFFDEMDGLRILFNVISTLDIGATINLDDTRPSDDQIFANRQTTRHVCGALKYYFEAHLVAEVERRVSSSKSDFNPESKPYKALDLSYENIENCMEAWRDKLSPNLPWRPVDEFVNLKGISCLLELITFYFQLSYSGKAETVKSAVDIIKIMSLTLATQLLLCERISTDDYDNITGIQIFLKAADGEMAVPEIQKSALHTIINCVCTKLPEAEGAIKTPTIKKKSMRSIEDCLNKLWKTVRMKNGINLLINLLSNKTPLSDADKIRQLACEALCGLSRSETVKQIISKLPLINDGQLLEMMNKPVLSDKGHDHVRFCKLALELIERVTGAPLSNNSNEKSSLFDINQSEIVSKTKIIYHETQLLQLIAEHLTSIGFHDSVEVLQREMSEKIAFGKFSSTTNTQSLISSTPIRSSLSSTIGPSEVARTNRNVQAFMEMLPRRNAEGIVIPHPPVPLKINLNKDNPVPEIEHKQTPSRFSKPPVCSGNYNQTPVMKRYNHQLHLGGSEQPMSLNYIVSEYLRTQHSLCKYAVLACPPFDLFSHHKCPEPTYKKSAPLNSLLRLHKKELSSSGSAGYGTSALDLKFIYSRYKVVRSFRDEEGRDDFASAAFLNYNCNKPRVVIGTLGSIGHAPGRLIVYNAITGEEILHRDAQHRGVTYVESSKFNSLVISSYHGRMGSSTFWNADANFEVVHNFNELRHLEFGKSNSFKAIGTRRESAVIIDTSTCLPIQEFPYADQGNGYKNNFATFDYQDNYILSDGLIWDARGTTPVHKLDKFNATSNGVFHPNGREIISNTEIWDLRTFKLLRTVPELEQSRITFNEPGSIIYAVYSCRDSYDEKANCFYTFNASDYSPIATIDVKKPVFHLAIDRNDMYVASIENQGPVLQNHRSPLCGVDCVSRLYEVGRTREEGDEDDEDSDSEDDSDDEIDDEEENDGSYDDSFVVHTDEEQNDDSNADDDVVFEIDEDDDNEEEDSPQSSDADEALFSLNVETLFSVMEE